MFNTEMVQALANGQAQLLARMFYGVTCDKNGSLRKVSWNVSPGVKNYISGKPSGVPDEHDLIPFNAVPEPVRNWASQVCETLTPAQTRFLTAWVYFCEFPPILRRLKNDDAGRAVQRKMSSHLSKAVWDYAVKQTPHAINETKNKIMTNIVEILFLKNGREMSEELENICRKFELSPDDIPYLRKHSQYQQADLHRQFEPCPPAAAAKALGWRPSTGCEFFADILKRLSYESVKQLVIEFQDQVFWKRWKRHLVRQAGVFKLTARAPAKSKPVIEDQPGDWDISSFLAERLTVCPPGSE